MNDTQSIQDRLFTEGTCFGCGPNNSHGLRLKSFERNGVIEADWKPSSHHGNGYGALNGGIISTLLDCHTASCMLVMLGNRYGVQSAEQIRHYAKDIPIFVTQKLKVSFRRPVPLDKPLRLISQCVSFAEREGTFIAQLYSEGRLCAEGEAVWKPLRRR